MDSSDAEERDALVTEMMIVEVVNAALRMELVSGIGAAALDLEIHVRSDQTAGLTRGVVAMDVVYVVTSTSWMRLLKRSKPSVNFDFVETEEEIRGGVSLTLY